MRSYLVAAVLLMLLITCINAFGQTLNGTISGTVDDPSAASIPGVKISATNTGTNVITTTTSNAAGLYNFPSLQPGTYKVTAEMSGFQTRSFTDVQLNNAGQLRINFTLQVAARTETVEVSVAAERLILESSSSVGEVLGERKIEALPLVSNNILDLFKVMGGTTISQDAIYGGNNTTFAGVAAGNVNIQRDGVTVNDVRYTNLGLNSPTVMNPDLVGEFRMIVSPVDAETGRGAGQIQIMTKSGANTFHGSLVWNVQNSALDGNRWDYNRSGTIAPWRNQHEYSISASGPIIRDKTFFFALWDGLITRTREAYVAPVLTPCARKGIFRYFDGWNNGNRLAQTVSTGNPQIAVVDAAGNPVTPATNPNGTPFTGSLRYASVFGMVTNAAGKPSTWDCSDATFGAAPTANGAWDQYRTAFDTTGFISKFQSLLPLPNYYDQGDGLNVAGYRWVRGLKGADNLFGIGEPVNRKQINVKIDHNFNSRHRMSGNWSFEKNESDDQFRNWPGMPQGANLRQPQVLTAIFTSTLRPTLLNEFRFGMSRQGTNTYPPILNPQNANSAILKDTTLLPKINGTTLIIDPNPILGLGQTTTGGFGGPSGFLGSRGLAPKSFRDTSPRFTYADTVTWTRGRHSFKGGVEIRRSHSDSITDGNWAAGNTIPNAVGGSLNAYSPILNINSTNMPGLAGTTSAGNRRNMMALLDYQAGSVGQILQYRFINSPTQTEWNDPSKELYIDRDTVRNEFSLFLKDDWKTTDSLTLNLGVRYEWFGVPYVKSGITSGWAGDNASVFGISGRDFSAWMPASPSATYDSALLVKQAFVGPGSPNPDRQIYPDDWNNIGPAVGFAWQLPWFGKGKTTLRGGYQISYIAPVGLADASGVTGTGVALGAASTYSNSYTGQTSIPYINLVTLPTLGVIPAPILSGIQPGPKSYPVNDRTQTMAAFDPKLVSPYFQTLTMSLTRNIGSNLTVELRYTGTLTRKSTGTININSPNFLTNNFLGLGSLKEAFDAARSGGESPLLDKIFDGINIVGPGSCPVGQTCGGVLQTGAGQMRQNTTLQTNLANGNYSAVANSLSTMNYNTTYPGNSGLPARSGVNGTILTRNGFPENYIRTNPQFATANLLTNMGHSNYHGMQAQVTYRSTHGLSLQGTYTWSRNLGLGAVTDPRDFAEDYTLLSTHRSHMLALYGTWELPFGANGLLLKNSSGLIERIAGGWQISWIGNATTGQPFSISAGTMLYGNGVPDLVGPWKTKAASVTWADGATSGQYFGNAYSRISDPQCNNVASSIRSLCTLQAVVETASRQIIFQNPQPGARGNFGSMNMTGPASWNVDMALSKAIRITEGKRIQFRVDATNVFNHPQPGGNLGGSGVAIVYANPPLASINSTTNTFGEMTSKAGRRVWQAKLRFDF